MRRLRAGGWAVVIPLSGPSARMQSVYQARRLLGVAWPAGQGESKMSQCDACQAQGIEVHTIVDMFGNQGNVCGACKQAMEDDACIGCGS